MLTVPRIRLRPARALLAFEFPEPLSENLPAHCVDLALDFAQRAAESPLPTAHEGW